jgi:hypothetical protein
MSGTLIEQETVAPETGLLRREFAAEVTAAEGRTVDVRIVPYGEQIEHNDGLGGVPMGVFYREEWVAGAFDHQLNAANRVLANCEHERGIRGVVGHGVSLREDRDGLYGSFKIHETPAGDTALLLIREGVYNTVSLEAAGRKSIRAAGGVVRRVKADLRGLSFTRFGAYEGAKVLAIREQVFEEETPLLNPDPELIERCRSLGIRLPQRYQAPPDATDTPAEAGTSEDGTRQADINTTSEGTT